MKNLFVIIVPFLLMSCASFNKNHSFKNEVKLNENSISLLNGSYTVNPSIELNKGRSGKIYFTDKGDLNRTNLYNFFNNSSRSLNDFQDSTYLVKLKVINKNEILIFQYNNDQKMDSILLKYKLKSNGYIYIKNKNFKINGVPYLFGGFELNRIRITLSNENNLVFNSAHYFYGSFLILFGDARKTLNNGIYKRI